MNTNNQLPQKILLAALLATTFGTTHGAGFAIIEQSTSMQGNAYAGAAAQANDASTIFFNPAGMSKLKGAQLVQGAHIILPSFKFTNNGSTVVTTAPTTGGNGGDGGVNAFVPNFYYVRPINDKMKFGLGIFAPFGLATKYDSDWVGRYQAIESSIETLNFNPSISYQATDKLAVGFGLSAMYIRAKLSSAVDYAAACLGSGAGAAACGASGLGLANVQTAAATGLSVNKGTDWAFGFNFGLLYDLSDKTRIGIAYRSEVRHKLKGTGDFDYGTTLAAAGGVGPTLRAVFADTPITVNADLPATLSISIHHQVNPNLALMADFTRTGWSSIPELRIDFANPLKSDGVEELGWKDVNRFSFGATWKHNDRMTLRAGVAWDESPVPNSTKRTARLPDSDRTWLSLGMNYKYSKKTTIDAAYTHIFVKDSVITRTGALSDTLRGNYESGVDILSLQVKIAF